MAFESVQITSRRNGASPITGTSREDLVAGDVVGLALSSTVGVTTVLWELLGRPELSTAGGAGPEPIALATAPTASFTVDADVGAVHKDGTYLVRATINPGSPGQVRKTAALARTCGLTIPGIGGSRSLRKPGGCESLEDTSVPNRRTGYETADNRWKELLLTIATGGGVIETLAGAYSVGLVAADQTLVLDDAHGGGVVINATAGGFTGTSALRINTAASGVVVVDRATGNLGVGIAAPLATVHAKGTTPAIRLDRTAGQAIEIANVTDSIQIINRSTGNTVLATIPGTGGLRTDFGVGIGAAAPTAAALAMGAGSGVAVSLANTGRLRYNEVTQQWESSSNTGAYVPFGAGTGIQQFDGISTGATQLASFVPPGTGAVYAYVKSVRDMFYLDRTNAQTADGITIVTATGGGRWIRMLFADEFWGTQTTWFIDTANVSTTATDEATGVDGTHQLRTRAEFHRRFRATTAATTVTVTGSLVGTDTFVAPLITTLAAPVNWVGVPVALFSGTVTGYVARSGAGSQPTTMTIAALPASWTASGLVDQIIECVDGGTTIRAVVVADLGTRTAWLSPPINQGNTQDQVFINGTTRPLGGTTVTVWDVPSLGNTVLQDTGFQTYKYFRSSRWMSVSGRLDCTNCLGPVNLFNGSYSAINCNSFPGVDDGNHNITGNAGSQANIIGGRNSVVGALDMRLSGHGNFGTLRPEIGAIFETHIATLATATDIEIYNASATIASFYFGSVSGGTVIANGYIYGTSVTVTDAVQFLGRDGTLSCSRTPVITGAGNITFGLAATTVAVTLLNAKQVDDVFNNRAIGPAGPTWNDNRSQTMLNLGSAAGVLTSAANLGDVVAAVASATNTVLTKAALVAIDTTAMATGARRWVQTYRSWFTLDKVTTRSALPDVVVAPTVGGGWWVRDLGRGDPFWQAQTLWFIDPAGTNSPAGNDEGDGLSAAAPIKSIAEWRRRVSGAQYTTSVAIKALSGSSVTDDGLLYGITTDNLASSVTIFGTPTVLFSGTVSSYQAYAGNTRGSFADPSLAAASWTLAGGISTTSGSRFVRKAGSGSRHYAPLLKDLGSKTVQMGLVVDWDETNTTTLNFTATDFVNGDAYEVVSMPTWPALVADGANVRQQCVDVLGSQSPQFRTTDSGNHSFNHVLCGMITANTIVGSPLGTRFMSCVFVHPSGTVAVGAIPNLVNSALVGTIFECGEGELNWNTQSLVAVASELRFFHGVLAASIGTVRSFDSTLPCISVRHASNANMVGVLVGSGNSGALVNVDGGSYFHGANLISATTSAPLPYVVNGVGYATPVVDVAGGNGIYGLTTVRHSNGGDAVDPQDYVPLHQVQALAAAGVPTFTPGSIIFANGSGALAQDNANFFFDDTNNRLGVGTNTPTTDLDIVRSGATFAAVRVLNASGSATAGSQFFASNGTTAISVGVTGTAYAAGGVLPNLGSATSFLLTALTSSTLYIGSTGIITIQTGATQAERVRILATGEVQLSSLAAGGLVKAAVTTGQLSLAVAGTDYLAPSGALTPGSVLFASPSGQVTQDNPNLFWDDTNNRLGVGTTTPTRDIQASRGGSDFTSIFSTYTGSATTGGASFSASAGSAGAQMGVTSSAYVALPTLPNLGAGQAYVVSAAGGSLYVGGYTGISFQTGTPNQAARLNILSTGELQASSLAGISGGGVVVASLVNGQLSSVASISDAQHGARAGGTLHAVATTSVAGFMSAADKANLDGLVVGGGVPSSRQLIAGTGLTGGGDLTADRTFNVIANADATIVVNANDIQVGVIGTANIANNSVSMTKLEPIGPAKVIGFDGPGAGTPFDISVIAPLRMVAGSGQLTFGTGFTAGSVVFQGASQIAEDNGRLFWDNSNKRLGIGTNAPLTVLHVREDNAGFAKVTMQNNNAGTQAAAQFIAANASAFSGSIGVTGTGYTTTAGQPDLGPNTSFFMTASSSGNIYIGSAGAVEIATGIIQTRRVTILQTGEVRIASLSAGGVVQSDASTGALSDLTMVVGQIPFGEATTGKLTQDPLFVWDTTTDRLGLGTSAPNSIVDAQKSLNGLAAVSLSNGNAGTAAQAAYIAANGSLSFSVGIRGTAATAPGGLPNLAANMGFLNHADTVYVGSNNAITFQTGTVTQTERMRILPSGEVAVLSKIVGGTTPAAALILQGTTNAIPGTVTVNDSLGVGRTAGVIGGAPRFAVAGGVTVSSLAGASLDYFVVNSATITVSGATNITNANGFNYASIEAPVYNTSVVIGAGGTTPAAATLKLGGPPSIGTGGGSFAGAGPVTLWVVGKSVLGQMEVTGNLTVPALFLNGSSTALTTVSFDVDLAGNTMRLLGTTSLIVGGDLFVTGGLDLTGPFIVHAARVAADGTGSAVTLPKFGGAGRPVSGTPAGWWHMMVDGNDRYIALYGP